MKKNKYINSLYAIAFMLFTAFVTDERAEKALDKIQKYYDTHSNKNFIYLKYSSSEINDGKQGEPLVAELWIDQEKVKVKYENPFMLLYQDKQCKVTVLKESRQVLIHPSDSKDLPVEANAAAGFNADSLKKYASSISYKEAGEYEVITLQYPVQVNRQFNPLRNVILESTTKGELKKMRYEYKKDNETQVTIMEYLKSAYSFDKTILSSSALALVFDGNKLNPAYKDYNVQDFRNIKK